MDVLSYVVLISSSTIWLIIVKNYLKQKKTALEKMYVDRKNIKRVFLTLLQISTLQNGSHSILCFVELKTY